MYVLTHLVKFGLLSDHILENRAHSAYHLLSYKQPSYLGFRVFWTGTVVPMASFPDNCLLVLPTYICITVFKR